MKIALLLTGQLRTYRLNRHIIKNAIINKYDTDVFISIDSSNTYQDANLNTKEETTAATIKDVISFYNPCDYFVCYDYSSIFSKIKPYLNPISNFQNIDNYQGIFEQYYIVNKAYEMLMDYKKKTHTNYDIIIRLRFDHIIWPRSFEFPSNLISSKKTIYYNSISENIIEKISKEISIRFEIPNNNEVYTAGYGNINNLDYVNDHFWFHSDSSIDIFHSYYDKLIDIINNYFKDNRLIGSPWYEVAFSYFIKMNKVDVSVTNIVGLFSRELIKG